jgi:uncharacterized membrane protein
MNLLRSIIAWLLAAVLASPSFGQGITYPDGSVSPFKPGFFGVGIPSPATRSYVFGVAAKGGTFIGAVGQINGLELEAGQGPALWRPGSFLGLPRSDGLTNNGSVSAISADGKIKVGDGGLGAAYWDEANQLHSLPTGGGENSSAEALAITPDGSVIAGNVADRDPAGEVVIEAALWRAGGTNLTKLGRLPGFVYSSATGISEDDSAVCGYLTFYDNNTGVGGFRAFLHENGQMERLPTLGIFSDTHAYGISVGDGSLSVNTTIVGTISQEDVPKAVRWLASEEISPPRLLEGSGTSSAAYAVNATSNAPSGTLGRIVGYNEDAAFMWARSGAVEGSIKGLLASPYKVSEAAGWSLSSAQALSADGYTVGGFGFNPEGGLEGWVAVMPPILHPPILVRPPNQIPPPGEPFFYQVQATNDPFKRASYSAKNLPKGFSIDAQGRIAGLWSSNETDKIGTYTVTVSATTLEGTGTTTFTISLQPPPGATTPAKSQSIQGHTFLPQNKPPGEQTFLASFSNGTSSNGQVAVGQDGLFNDARAYRWTATEGSSGLPMLEGALRTYSTASAVSADGNTIVGQSAAVPADDGSNRSVATVWRPPLAATAKAIRKNERHYAESATAASLEAINLGLFQGGIISLATGVSADGSVVVGYGDGKNPDPNVNIQIYQAFRWTQGSGRVGLGWIDLTEKVSQAWGVSPDGSIIVGSDYAQAFRWTEAEGMVGMGKGPGALGCRANGVSADNSTIIGFNTYNPQNDNNRAFRWTASEGFVDLGVLPGDQYSEPKAISADGSVIVGQSGIKFAGSRAFIWDKTNGMRNLKEVLVAGNPSLANWTLRSATGISADGKTIVGAGANPNGDSEGFTAVLDVRPAQLLNISTRMRVLTGEKVLIGGFIITGTQAKKVMIRGIGPSLSSAGLQGVMADPTLELHQGTVTLIRNDNWKTRADGSSQQAEIQATTIPPANNLESAIVTTLSPGNYTAILADKNGGPGLGLVEVYDLAQQSNSKLANISTRGFVDTGDNVMIGGFIAGGGSSGAFAGELVRAIGPSLTSFGVAGALQDTTLELYNSNGILIASNDNWRTRADGSSQQAEIEASTIPPSDDRESAIAAIIAPGNYTAIVRGKASTTGVSLVEVYHLQ